MVAPPAVPDERLSNWRRVDDTTETPFDAAGVTVSARVVLFEDDDLRTVVRDRAGVDRIWRFFLAARLSVSPVPPVPGTLRGLVATRAGRDFADRLDARGFTAVDRVERRSLRIGDDDATLFRYDARCHVEGVTLSVDGWLATWVPDRDVRLAGGAYPTGVVDATEPDAAAALRDALDPTAFRSELFELIRGTG
ncbi:hypothetical protein [Haloplanus salilacus]|uniref:hypothetical protein n=1 Tax=Haloplanus salilacus TaxID=2949994 RepID=UPI0030D5CB45